MKKLSTAFAACMLAGFVSAQVESQNIVGYNTVTLSQGYNLVAVNFGTVGGGLGLTLQTLFPTTTNGVLLAGFTGGSAATGDNIAFYDPIAGYTVYYLYKGAKTSDTKNYKWVTAAGVVADDTPVASGTAFWFKKVAAGNLDATVAGEAANDVSTTMLVKPGYNTFTSVYPIEWNPNDFGATYWTTNGAVAGSAATGDNIAFYDPTLGYTAYYLYKGAKTSDTKNYKWVSATGVVVADKIMVPGKGAWYKHAGAGFAFSQTKPY